MPLKQEKIYSTHNNINNNNINNYNNNNIKGSNESVVNAASIISTASTTYVTATSANALATTYHNNSATSSAEIIELKCKLESAAAAIDKKSPVTVQIADMAAEQRTIAYQANAKLCRLVRKCPWMYDRHHHNYAKKNILDKSWAKIAKECNDSVASCKERWRNIRAAFARSINIYKTHSGPNRIKPYYLHKELSFLVKPMMEGRDRRDDFDDDTRNDMDIIKEDEADDYDDDGLEHSSGNADNIPDDSIDIKSAFEALNPTIHIHNESFSRICSNNNSTYNNDTNNNNNNNHDNHDNNNNFNNNTINCTSNSANVNNTNVANEFEAAGLFDAETEFTSDAEIEFNYNDEPTEKRQSFPNINTNNNNTINNLKNTNSNQHNSTGHKRTLTPMDAADGIEMKRSKLITTNAQTSEADAQFLEALLPDMALMNIRQKIVFKRKIYQTLEDVLENATDFPIVNTSKEYNSSSISSNTPLNSNMPLNSNNDPAKAAISNVGTQVRQTILTVNSSTARSLINNIANLNESDLQKVNNFLQNSIQNSVTSNRYINGGIAPATPSCTAVRLMHSAPKITITKVSCPPPASLRNLNTHTPPPILQSQHLQSYSTPLASKLFITPTTHSLPLTTAASTAANTTPTQLVHNDNLKNNNVNSNSQWNSMLPVTIKDEVEDVDID